MTLAVATGARFARTRMVTGLVLAASAYAGLACATIELTSDGRTHALLWLADAIILSLLLLRPRSQWPAILFAGWAANFVANVVTRDWTVGLLLYGAINMAQVSIAASRLAPHMGSRGLLEDGRAALRFALWAGFVAPLAGAAAGAAGAYLNYGLPFWPSALRWYTSNALGLVVFTPFVASLIGGEYLRCYRARSPRHRVEMYLLLALTAGITWVVFFKTPYPLLFVPLVTLLLVAFRAGRLAAQAGVIVIAAIGTVSTLQGLGPIAAFPTGGEGHTILLQIYLAILLAVTLPIAAVVSARADAMALLQARQVRLSELLEQQQADAERYAESEHRYRLMAAHSNDMVVLIGLDGARQYVSPASQALLGYSPEELIGHQPTAAIHPDDVDRVLAVCRSLLEGATDPICTYRQRHRDGHYVWLEASYRLVQDGAHVPTNFVASVRDVSGRRAAEEKAADASARLHEQNRFFAMASSLAKMGHWRVDLERNELTWSDEVYRIYGRRRGQAPDLAGAIDYFIEQDRATIQTTLDRAIAEGGDFSYEATMIASDGVRRNVSVVGQAERSEGGKAVALFGVVQDITEQVAIREAAVRSEQQYRLLADRITDIIVRLDLEDRCTYASPAIEAVTGSIPEDVLGVDLIDTIHPADRERVRELHANLREGRSDHLVAEYRTLHRSGKQLWLEARSNLIRDGEGRPVEVISVVRDVTHRKALEAQLVAARNHAEAAAAAKSAFLANMSHEIRTPMNGVLGFAELVLASDIASPQRRQVEMIADSGRAMMGLLNDILDISKIEAGKMVLAQDAVDLRKVVGTCVELMSPIAEGKGVSLTAQIDADVPACILGDTLRLRQVLLNLLGNAAKFTQQGSIWLRVHQVGGRLIIEVADTGIGIARDRLASIFDQFAQADSKTAQDFGGSGLGLTITSELVALMRGTITVDSVMGLGSKFVVDLPLQALANCSVPQELPSLEVSTRAGQARVLVAEDHDINQQLMLGMAAQAGIQIDIAADGHEAIAMVAEAARAGRPYALVLMDLQMPCMGGVAATQAIRAAGHDAERLPIVALTANAYADDIKKCLDAGMQAHLAKPLRLSDLKTVMARYLPGESAPDAEAAKISPRLLEKYHARRRETLDVLTRLNGPDAGDMALRQHAADLLHKLAGTAALFGEEALGDEARNLEDRLMQPPGECRAAIERCVENLRQAA